ncbi:hypothetical protein JQC92_12675 [Shewanella sp. 202IG2-18]|uniref:hypothetical protein n=1 Tax=Parashewanella hymeniacidonis TaxID=2807618 RepID=UPI00195FA509|nr:hypothetical protein [Parashewanella hymeniacidonis]MBM7072875.1 hypothetical protein [Parashewanella hymeniacidonis]
MSISCAYAVYSSRSEAASTIQSDPQAVEIAAIPGDNCRLRQVDSHLSVYEDAFNGDTIAGVKASTLVNFTGTKSFYIKGSREFRSETVSFNDGEPLKSRRTVESPLWTTIKFKFGFHNGDTGRELVKYLNNGIKQYHDHHKTRTEEPFHVTPINRRFKSSD